MKTCCHCGVTSNDVAAELVYEGGTGMLWRDLCANRDACWNRWEVNHGLLLKQVA